MCANTFIIGKEVVAEKKSDEQQAEVDHFYDNLGKAKEDAATARYSTQTCIVYWLVRVGVVIGQET